LWCTKRLWADFLLVLRFPRQAFHPHSLSSIVIRGWYNRPVMDSVKLDSVSLHPQEGKGLFILNDQKVAYPNSCLSIHMIMKGIS
jgi:hypothetical protein